MSESFLSFCWESNEGTDPRKTRSVEGVLVDSDTRIEFSKERLFEVFSKNIGQFKETLNKNSTDETRHKLPFSFTSYLIVKLSILPLIRQ